uniref:CASPASE_P20 domain-containing protein n=1 Tax=Globodera pallida TaxID=36090 RepID=A0A183BSI8_GLOPA
MSHGLYDAIAGSDDNFVDLHTFVGQLNGVNCPASDQQAKNYLRDQGAHVRESVGAIAGTSGTERRRDNPWRSASRDRQLSRQILAHVQSNQDMLLAMSTAPHHVSIRDARKVVRCFAAALRRDLRILPSPMGRSPKPLVSHFEPGAPNAVAGGFHYLQKPGAQQRPLNRLRPLPFSFNTGLRVISPR